MCVVSAVSDGWRDQWEPRIPKIWPDFPTPFPKPKDFPFKDFIESEEIRKLRQEVEDLKELLKAAKKYDEKTGQPDCEMEDKIRFLKQVAEGLGISLEDIFPK